MYYFRKIFKSTNTQKNFYFTIALACKKDFLFQPGEGARTESPFAKKDRTLNKELSDSPLTNRRENKNNRKLHTCNNNEMYIFIINHNVIVKKKHMRYNV